MIAFPMSGPMEEKMGVSILGDIVISVDTALKEAKEYGEELEHRIERLAIHGILHLLGYDHEKNEEEAIKMEKEEDRLLSMLKEVK